jgi:LuxR family maltose regulon positive regulatory protein
MATPLLTTKLYVPPARLELVPRPRLIEQLNKSLTGKLTLISAPAGFGKTTLLSEWIPQSERCVTWVSLDRGDNDPTRFWVYFISALQMLHTDLGQNALVLLQSPQAPSLEFILTGLLNELAAFPDDFASVLEDYHLIENPAIHETVAFLLDHLPAHMHLVITTRIDPPLPLSRLRARRQLTELRAANLRFTPGEVTVFLNEVMSLSLSARDVAALEARTEGWIAGLQLVALSMQGRQDTAGFIEAFTGSHRYILDYLVDEVLERQGAEVKNFLLCTSILKRMSAPLCDAVTGQNGSQAMLEQLEQANLFITSLDDNRGWYRYHHLFADVLQVRLRQSRPDLLPDLHRRASQWYEACNSLAEAVQHALAAGDDVRAASLIEQVTWTLLGHGEANTLRGWLDRLPVETVRTRPRLSLAYAWILSLMGQIEAIEPRLQDAERALTAAISKTSDQSAEIDAIPGQIATLRAQDALAQSDMRRAIELCRHALTLLPAENILMRGIATLFLGHAELRSGHVAAAEQAYIEAGAFGMQADNLLLGLHGLANLSTMQRAMGRLRKAAETSQYILQIIAEHRQPAWPVTGLAYFGLGLLYYQWNDLDAAARHLRLGIEFGQRGGLTDLEINSRDAMAFTLQAQHDPSGADEMLRQIAAMIEGHRYLGSPAQAAAQAARLQLRQGRIDQAVLWTERCGLRIDDTAWPYHREAEYLTLARVFIAQGQVEIVQDLLDRLLQTAESDKRTGSLVEILILQALARQAQGDSTGAMTAIANALALAEPEGYVRIFVDEGAAMAKLLRQAQLCGLAPNYVGKLLAAFRADERENPGEKELQSPPAPLPPRPAALPLVEPLSPREVELLRLVAAGQSNQEIAQELFLAVGTVKKHLNNIFGKLDVQSRTQAITRARELDLL